MRSASILSASYCVVTTSCWVSSSPIRFRRSTRSALSAVDSDPSSVACCSNRSAWVIMRASSRLVDSSSVEATRWDSTSSPTSPPPVFSSMSSSLARSSSRSTRRVERSSRIWLRSSVMVSSWDLTTSRSRSASAIWASTRPSRWSALMTLAWLELSCCSSSAFCSRTAASSRSIWTWCLRASDCRRWASSRSCRARVRSVLTRYSSWLSASKSALSGDSSGSSSTAAAGGGAWSAVTVLTSTTFETVSRSVARRSTRPRRLASSISSASDSNSSPAGARPSLDDGSVVGSALSVSVTAASPRGPEKVGRSLVGGRSRSASPMRLTVASGWSGADEPPEASSTTGGWALISSIGDPEVRSLYTASRSGSGGGGATAPSSAASTSSPSTAPSPLPLPSPVEASASNSAAQPVGRRSQR